MLTEDEGNAFWFLNTLTINKVEGEHTHGELGIVDHRVPPGFAPPPHVHAGVDEVFYILDGEFEGFCGRPSGRPGPARSCSCPETSRTGSVSRTQAPGRTLIIVAPAGFEQFVAALGEPAADLTLPQPVEPDVERVIELAAAHGIQILPPPPG